MQTNADENGTRTRATFVTRKYVKITLTWRHNQLGHLTNCRMIDGSFGPRKQHEVLSGVQR
jgi:hypothetical protein